jgi:5-methylcytosine-specific restriction protein A
VRVRKFCLEQGCKSYAEPKSYRCTTHKRAHINTWNTTQRDPNVKAFYASAAWKRTREKKLSANPVCELCQDQPAAQVHHIVKASEDVAQRLVMANLQSTCASCHARETVKERKDSAKNKKGGAPGKAIGTSTGPPTIT